MKTELNLVVNGEPRQLFIEPTRLLVEVLRDDLGLTGTKRGCNSSSCAACTALVDGMAVKTCSILALQVQGRNVTTIEGLATGSELHPLQQAFIDHWAFQCGFCTPGQIMGAAALLAENPTPTREEVKMAMDGHLCRCTGYNMIEEAILDAGERMKRGSK